MSDLDLYWAAGLFEGEGCITVYKSGGGRYTYPQAVLAMTDEDVVRRFAVIMGYGTVCKEVRAKRAPHHKTLWRWQVKRRADFNNFATTVGPLLGERRRARLLEVRALASKPVYETT